MTLRFPRLAASSALVVSALFFAVTDARAGEAPIAVGEVAQPSPEMGFNATEIRDAAEGELRMLDTSGLSQKRVVVSLVVTRPAIENTVACSVSATLRDAKTGNMIAIIETRAAAEGPGSLAIRRRVADGAVRNAVRKIPDALKTK